MKRILSILAGCFLLAGIACDKEGGKNKEEDLTIVVEADRSKIAAEEKKLKDRLSEFESERERLRKEKADLMASKDAAAGKDQVQLKRLSQMEKKLWAKEREMWSRESALEKERERLADDKSDLLGRVPAGKGGGIAGRERSVAGREKSLGAREASLAKREKDLAAREADLAKREAAFLRTKATLASARMPAMPRPGARSGSVGRGKAEKAYKVVLNKMRKRGILRSDLPLEFAGVNREIKEAKGEGDFSKMMDLVEQLEAVVAATRIDADFIDRKFARLAQLTREKKPTGKDKQKVSTLLRKATQLYGDGKFVKANRELNRIVALLTK
jgi:DNA repair exonuclease SbcCD ATPase subunit